jgi:hypothetical protein
MIRGVYAQVLQSPYGVGALIHVIGILWIRLFTSKCTLDYFNFLLVLCTAEG